MHRRSVLATLGALPVAGCLSGATDGGIGSAADGSGDPYPGLPEREQPDRTFAPDEVQRRVELAGVDDAPAAADLSIGVELLEGAVTGEHAARVAVTTTNRHDERMITVGEGGCAPFNRGGRSLDDHLILFRPGMATTYYGHGLTESDEYRVEPLWAFRHPEGGERPLFVYPAYGCSTRRYASGESVTTEYRVWDCWRGDGYLPAGVHRFEEYVSVYETAPPPDESPPCGDLIAEFTWGFELRVLDPEA